MCKLLALDTSSVNCSVAYYEGPLIADYRVEWPVDMICEKAERAHTRLILPMIDDLLKRHQVELEQLDAIAYGRGPGSFTGLRIAAGVVQGLAYGGDLPVIPVSSLAGLAVSVLPRDVEDHSEQTILACTDARMGEVYFGWFKLEGGKLTSLGEEGVCKPEDLPFDVAQRSVTCVGSGASYLERFPAELQECIGAECVKREPQADSLIPCALDLLQQGKTVAAAQAQPAYIRDTVTWKKLPGKE